MGSATRYTLWRSTASVMKISLAFVKKCRRNKNRNPSLPREIELNQIYGAFSPQIVLKCILFCINCIFILLSQESDHSAVSSSLGSYTGRVLLNGCRENFHSALRRCDWLEQLCKYTASNEMFCLFYNHYSTPSRITR